MITVGSDIKGFSELFETKTALVTYIYPSATKYLKFLVESINAQTTKDFVFVVFNDGVLNPEQYFDEIKVPTICIPAQGENPMDVRFIGIEHLKKSYFQKIIFQDSDDLLSSNRVECVSGFLDKYPLVVNDLDLIDESGVIYSYNIWRKRFYSKDVFCDRDILHYNFLGFTNTAIRLNVLDFDVVRPLKEVVAVDWYIFYSMTVILNKKGYFTSACTSKYRQHASNTIGAGIKQTNQDFIKHVKSLHYDALVYSETIRSKPVQSNYSISKKSISPFWWEEFDELK